MHRLVMLKKDDSEHTVISGRRCNHHALKDPRPCKYKNMCLFNM
jgi:hypothetical protein